MMVCEHSTLSNQFRDWGWIHGKVLRWSLALTYPLADVRVTASSSAIDDLATLSGVLRARFDVVYNTILLCEPVSYKNALIDSVRRGRGGMRIIAMGNLKQQKSLAMLIYAFAMLAGTYRVRPAERT